MTRPRPVWTPPARDGVSASRLALGPGPWATVAECLAARLRPGIDWPARMALGDVLDARGRPLGLQLIGPARKDTAVLGAALAHEALLPWRPGAA